MVHSRQDVRVLVLGRHAVGLRQVDTRHQIRTAANPTSWPTIRRMKPVTRPAMNGFPTARLGGSQ
jgi:hypothetical protein